MLNWFDMISRFYANGSWTLSMVAEAVEFKKLNTDEFEQITGQQYDADEDNAE
ncbi:hypothetical protein JCM19037_1424 [Geomicrobium sp. JCM 19037]|uniref:XkdX family protein n=1 Tax=Geomicrobium sp. JCM 19037 TaxID=1460634 RepID=UPI00045F2F18|nr:XkdX family protein [Geomicrobium sp. JCM 19037]GAK03130.1 hypothetical protein JCM19037_1424 [Geomicrobium sp. JCM 19037]